MTKLKTVFACQGELERAGLDHPRPESPNFVEEAPLRFSSRNRDHMARTRSALVHGMDARDDAEPEQ